MRERAEGPRLTVSSAGAGGPARTEAGETSKRRDIVARFFIGTQQNGMNAAAQMQSQYGSNNPSGNQTF